MIVVPHLGTDLPNDLANPQANLTTLHFEPILRSPDEMIAMVKSRVTTGADSHSLYPPEK